MVRFQILKGASPRATFKWKRKTWLTESKRDIRLGDWKNGRGGRKWKKERWKSFGDMHIHIVPYM
jgi:hypothetical protein